MSQQNTPGNDPNNGRDESQSPYGAQGAAVSYTHLTLPTKA